MKLIEITGIFQIEAGSPSPVVISDEHNLFVLFYSNCEPKATPLSKDGHDENEVVIINFSLYQKYLFGSPNDETISGHPYYKLGLSSYGFFELIDSDLIKQLKRIDSVHPYHTSKRWDSCKHYILTFHDSMFECVAGDYQVQKGDLSIYEYATISLKKMFDGAADNSLSL